MVASEVEVPDGAVRKPFRLRGGNFTLLVLPLADLKDQDFFRRLLDQVSQAPNFFHNAPVVLDLDGLSSGGASTFAELRSEDRRGGKGVVRTGRDRRLVVV